MPVAVRRSAGEHDCRALSAINGLLRYLESTPDANGPLKKGPIDVHTSVMLAAVERSRRELRRLDSVGDALRAGTRVVAR